MFNFLFLQKTNPKADVSAKINSHSISTTKAISQLHNNTKSIRHHQRNTRSSHRQNHPSKIKRTDRHVVGNGGKGLSNKRSSNKQVTANLDEVRIGNISGADEARYNLATRIMSNGVEVIVASDKSTLPGGQPNLRILSTSEHYRMPLTLAPSTLKDHMLLVVPTDGKQNSKNSKFQQASQVSNFKYKYYVDI